MMASVRMLPVGRDAVLVEVDSSHDAVSLAAWATEHRLADDVVPGARTVLLDRPVHPDALAASLERWTPADLSPGPEVEVSVTYDGPDLDFLAELWDCETSEVIERHTTTAFVSAFCGFAPGFAYLSGLPDDLPEVPRLATPRTRVLAGSVGLAGRWCGVYPRESPGGWRILGHTDTVLWDVSRQPPAVLAPGTQVQFRDASSSESPPPERSPG
jgi:KipI family sensor histidine kinase inhibitor